MKKLSLVVALLFVIESVVAQAPGDGSGICLPGGVLDFLRFTIPENMKVLMESRDYETLLGNSGEPDTWQQVDVDGLAGGGTTGIWTQQGSRGCQQIVTVCGFNVGQQNNWLITQHISRHTTTLLPQITVIVEYEFSDCETVMNCARTFSVWKYDNSTVDATLARDTSKYTQVAAIAPEDTTGSVRQNETIEVDFPGSETGFYLAIRDEDSCLLIHRVLVFYYVCPAITENLIIHPEILAPPISPTSQPINVNGGRCVPNATPTQGSNPILTCSQGGIWSVIVSCMCDPGFSMNADRTACILCSAGNFANDTSCLPCPANSNSTEPTPECPCFQGFYRDPSEGPGGDCALPPSAPLGLAVENRTDTTVFLSWQEPTSAGGGSNLEYNLFFQTPGADSRTLFGTVSETEGLITGLSPFLSYTLSVSSETSVTGTIPEALFSERSASVTVAETQSDLVPITDDGLVSVTGLVITWSIPASTMQFLRTYRLTITDDSNGNTVHDVLTNDTRFDASSLVLSIGSYSVKVRAIVNIGGSGDLPVIVGSGATLSLQDTTDGSPSSNNSTVIIAVIVAVVVVIAIILAIIAVIFYLWYRNSRVRSKGLYNNGIEAIALPQTGHSVYVDPTTYSSMDDAVQDFAKEIPPKSLRLDEEIGAGEFGTVYRGVWKTTDKKNLAIAVKTLKPSSSAKMRNDFLTEASIMGQFDHPNVIRLYGVVTKVPPAMIVMEFMDNGSLYSYLRRNDDKLGTNRLVKMARGVASGMEYLARVGYVHRDLAARNVLVSRDEKCKVADFGLSRETVNDEYDVKKGGKIPVRWTAPEAIAYRKFTTSSDVWSYGVLLWEVMSYAQHPYDDWDNQTVLDQLEAGHRLSKPKDCPDSIFRVMLECWNQDHVRRPSFENIVRMLDVLLEGGNVSEGPKPKPRTRKHSGARTQTKNPLECNTVEEWLTTIKMERYSSHFQKHGLTTVNECMQLTRKDLQDMGITLAGHLHKLTTSIEAGHAALSRAPSYRI